MRTRHLILGMMGAVVTFLVASAPWSHAVFVGMVAGTPCQNGILEVAADRVEILFGAKLASPWVICLDGSHYGLDVSHGSTRFTVMFPAIVIIGPEGRNPEVVAHEMAHAEISARTGPLLRTYKIPTWFDEGLAMQVDHRVDYSRRSLTAYRSRSDLFIPRLSAIAAPSSFFSGTDQGKVHYALAKCAIEEWQRQNAPQTTEDFLKQINWSSDFPITAFEDAEAICRSKSGGLNSSRGTH